MLENSQPTLLVTGASGHLGRRVVELLLEAQAGTIIATTRTPKKLADFAQRGVIVRHADFDHPASLAEAFKSVDRMLLISTDTLDAPGHRVNQHLAAIKAAQEAGIKHVIYTSIMNPGPDSPVLIAPDHYATEQALAESKMGWTVLRENLYAEILISTLNRAVQIGQLFSAVGDGKAAYITREDCARAAAAALASAFEGRQTQDITGPEALPQADLAAIATAITGKQVTYIPLNLETLIQNMVTAGLPQPLAEVFASFDTGIAQGIFEEVSNTVEELTQRKPTSVTEFLTTHREALLQSVAQI